jgi:hypothetical protein
MDGATIVKEQGFQYNTLSYPFAIDDQTEKKVVLDGYFQSYKYFEKYFSQILRLIQFEERKRESSYLMQKNDNCIPIIFQKGCKHQTIQFKKSKEGFLITCDIGKHFVFRP